MGANRPARDPSSVPLGRSGPPRAGTQVGSGALPCQRPVPVCHIAGTEPLQVAGLQDRWGIPQDRTTDGWAGPACMLLTHCRQETNLRKIRILFSSASAERCLGKVPSDAGIRTVTIFILPSNPDRQKGFFPIPPPGEPEAGESSVRPPGRREVPPGPQATSGASPHLPAPSEGQRRDHAP